MISCFNYVSLLHMFCHHITAHEYMWLKHFFYYVHFICRYTTHWHLFKSWLYWSVLTMCLWISLPLICLFTIFFLPLQNHKEMSWLYLNKTWLVFFFQVQKGTCAKSLQCEANAVLCVRYVSESFKSIVGTIKLGCSGLPQFCYLSPWKN